MPAISRGWKGRPRGCRSLDRECAGRRRSFRRRDRAVRLSCRTSRWAKPRVWRSRAWSWASSAYVLFCIGFFFSIPAIICGHIARANVRNSQGRLKGDGLALAGLICGYVHLAIFVLFMAFGAVTPAISGAFEKGRETSTMNDAKQISTACIRYASDHDGKYPDSLEELADKQGLDRNGAATAPAAAGFDYFGKGKTQAGITQPDRRRRSWRRRTRTARASGSSGTPMAMPAWTRLRRRTRKLGPE